MHKTGVVVLLTASLATTGSGCLDDPPPEPQLDRGQAKAALNKFYAAIDAGDGAKAWRLLGGQARNHFEGPDRVPDFYGDTALTVLDIDSRNVNPSTVKATVRIKDEDSELGCFLSTDTWRITRRTVNGPVKLVRVQIPEHLLNECSGPMPLAGGTDECDTESYPDPDVCIPPYPPDLDCPDVPYESFTVLAPDPHGFDGGENEAPDGIGCEPYP